MRNPLKQRGPRGRSRCEVVPGSPRLIVSSPSALLPPGTPGIIERVAPHPRKPGRYRVRLADGRQFLTDADGVTLAGAMGEGIELAASAIAQLEASHHFVSAYDRALGMLARARRSTRDIERKLRQREVVPDVIERVIERLHSLGLLNDDDVARAEAASRFRRGEGAGRIRRALFNKGVAGGAIDAAIREVAEEEQIDDAALCRSAGEKRLRSLSSYEPEVQRRRLMGFLLRRGFSGSAVHDVVRSLIPHGGARDQ